MSDEGADWQSDEERALRLALDKQMPGSGLCDRECAIAMLDRDLLVRDESGTPLNVREAIDELLERKPYLRDAMPAPPRVRDDRPPRGWRLARARRRVDGILIAGRCR
jgi:hypothetical protein